MSCPSRFRIYNVKEVIGGGGFATVFRVLRQGSDRALKQVKLTPIMDNARALKSARDEVELMKKLPEHRNIVKLFYACEDEGFVLSNGRVVPDSTHCLYLELEFCAGGTLQRQISLAMKERKLFSEELILDWFRQLATALGFIHELGIVHRDIKPSNIFLTLNLSTIKIGDFGISKDTRTYQLSGTLPYMAPEIFQSDYSCQSKASSYCPGSKEDVWSLGVVLFEMVTFVVPYNGRNISDLVQNIKAGRRAPLPNDHYSSDLRNLVNWLLSVQVNQRPTMKQVTADQFVKTGKKNSATTPQTLASETGNELSKLREAMANLVKENQSLMKLNLQTADELAKKKEEIACLSKRGRPAVESKPPQIKEGKEIVNNLPNEQFINLDPHLEHLETPDTDEDVTDVDEVISPLILRGASAGTTSGINYQDWFDCADYGRTKRVKAMIAKGADVNRKNSQDANSTALHYCYSSNCGRVARLLLRNGADVNARDKQGWTPLFHACMDGVVDIAAIFIEYGADVNAKDSDNGTPLMLACQDFGNLEIVKMLVNHPQFNTLNHRNNEFRTALSYAHQNHKREIFEFLISIESVEAPAAIDLLY